MFESGSRIQSRQCSNPTSLRSAVTHQTSPARTIIFAVQLYKQWSCVQVAAARRQASPSAEVDTSRDARRALPGGIGCQEALASTASDDDSDAVTFYTTSGDLSEEASALASRNANDAVPVGASDNASDATPEDGSGRASNDTPEAADLPTPPESEPDAV